MILHAALGGGTARNLNLLYVRYFPGAAAEGSLQSMPSGVAANRPCHTISEINLKLIWIAFAINEKDTSVAHL